MIRLYHGSNTKIEVLYTSETFDRLQEDETGVYLSEFRLRLFILAERTDESQSGITCHCVHRNSFIRFVSHAKQLVSTRGNSLFHAGNNPIRRVV